MRESGLRASQGWSPTSAALVLGGLWGLAAMGTSATSVVLGDLRADFGVGVSEVAWVLTIFALTFAAATPVFGRLADSYGPRTPYLVGVLLLVGGALVSAVAPDLSVLLAGRALQGVGAGAIPVLSTASLSLRFRGNDQAVAFGRINSALVIIASVGPILGGVLGSWDSWRLPFALPLLALFLLPVAYRIAPAGGTGERLDIVGAVQVAAAAAALLVLVQTLSNLGWLTLAAAMATPVLAVVVLRHIKHEPDGFLPSVLVGNGDLIRVSVAAAAMPLVYFGVLIALPLELAERGWSPFQNGLVLLPGALLAATVSFFSARLVARWGRVGTALRGMVVSAVGALLVSQLGLHPVMAVVGFVGMACGYAISQPALVGEASASVPESLRGGALGLFNLLFFIGAGLGAAIIGGLGEPLGTRWAVAVTAIAPVLAIIVLVVHRRRRVLIGG